MFHSVMGGHYIAHFFISVLYPCFLRYIIRFHFLRHFLIFPWHILHHYVSSSPTYHMSIFFMQKTHYAAPSYLFFYMRNYSLHHFHFLIIYFFLLSLFSLYIYVSMLFSLLSHSLYNICECMLLFILYDIVRAEILTYTGAIELYRMPFHITFFLSSSSLIRSSSRLSSFHIYIAYFHYSHKMRCNIYSSFLFLHLYFFLLHRVLSPEIIISICIFH